MLDMTKMVSANIDLSQFSISEIVKPYTIIERGGFKIGIIGMESDLSTNVSATVSSRIPQLDNVETINKYSEILHSQEKCDMIILFCGSECDSANPLRGLGDRWSLPHFRR